MSDKYLGSSNKGLFEWFLQRVSGVAIAIVIFIHFFSMIKGGDIGLDKLVAGPLLIFGLFHTFNGFKMIIDDFIENPAWRTVLIGFSIIIGTTLGIIGLHIIF